MCDYLFSSNKINLRRIQIMKHIKNSSSLLVNCLPEDICKAKKVFRLKLMYFVGFSKKII